MKVNLFSMRLHGIVIAIIVVALFGGSVTNDFVWDDTVITVGNKVYEDLDLRGIFLSLANRLEYLPIRDVSYAIDYVIWGWNSAGFHVTNVGIYLLNALALYLMTLKVLPLLINDLEEKTSRVISFLATILFVVHPIHSEVVNFVSCRNVLLSGVFFFLSCCFYLTFIRMEPGGGIKQYLFALTCFVLAILSKATAIILPLVLLLFVMFNNRGMRMKRAIELMPFFIIAGVAFIVFRTVAVKSGMINEGQVIVFGAMNFSSKLAIAVQIPFFYLKKLLVPEGLSVMYQAGFSRTISDAIVILSLLALAAIFLISIALRRKYPEVLFSVFWFMITLGPVLNLFLTTPVVADRYVYVPSYAFFFFSATLLLHRIHKSMRRLAIILLFPVVAVLSVICYERNGAWKSQKSLWEATVRVSPEAADAYSKLATIYMNEGNQHKASIMFEKLQKLDPASRQREYLDGIREAREGNLSEAIALFEEVVSADSNNIGALYRLGILYERTGEYEKAIGQYLKAIASGKIDPDGTKNLANNRLDALRNRLRPDLDIMRKKVNENPSDLNSRVIMAMTLDKFGMYDKALEEYNELLNRGGDNWGVYFNIANIYYKMGRLEEAASYFKKSLLFNKGNARIYNDLGIVYRSLKRFDEAIVAFERAIAIDKSYGFACFNLAVTYFQIGERENAVRYFSQIEQSFPALKDKAHDYMSQLQGY